MPKRTSATDRRGHGIGDNVSGKVSGKSNGLDQRTAGKFSPKAPGAQGMTSEFKTGVASARGPVTKPPARAVPKATKMGG
jgi:hypothetical protein